MCFIDAGNGPINESMGYTDKGMTSNASLTHLGAVEVIRLSTDEQTPDCIDFVTFGEIEQLNCVGTSQLRSALVTIEGRQPESVWVPLLYGLSWHSYNPSDRTGEVTRFILHSDLRVGPITGIGVGQQDFLTVAEGAKMIGFGGIRRLHVPLVSSDPDFEQRCRRRGIELPGGGS